MTKEAVEGHQLIRQMSDQPRALTRLLAQGKQPSKAVARTVRRRGPKSVLLAARGPADDAAMYAKYLVEGNLGLPASLVTPTSMAVYGPKLDLSHVLMLAIGQDGNAPDLIQVVRMAASGGATTVAITDSPESELARAARLHIDTMVGVEDAMPMTYSYSAQLLALWLFVDAYRGGDNSAASGVPDAAANLLARSNEVAELAARYQFIEGLATTGGGYSYPTAREAAREFVQTSNVAAHAFSGADLLHGPLAMIEQGHPVIAIVPDGLGAESMRPVLERLSDRGADVAVIGGRQSIPYATASFDVGCPGIVEELHPVVDIIAMQLLALELARVRGLVPDACKALSEMTAM